MKLKFTILTLVTVIISLGLSAQTIDDALKAVHGETPGKAKSILLGLLAKTPDDPETNYRLGNLYYQVGKKDSAKYYFEKGINPDDKVNYNFAGLGKLALDAKDNVKAEEYFNKLIGYGKSKDSKAYTFVAEAYANSFAPDLQKAKTHLEKAVSLNIRNGEAQLLLGDVLLKIDPTQAGPVMTKYDYAIDADPASPVPYLKKGQIYMKSGAYPVALENFQKGSNADPNFGPIIRELAEISYYQKNFGEAVRLYKNYMDQTGTDIPKLTRYASFLFLNKEYDKTIEIIEGIIKQDSSNVIMSRLIGYSYYEQEKYQQGLNFMKRFFEKADPAKVIGSDYAYYGKLLAKTDNDSLAIVYLEKAIEADSLNTELYNDLGQVLYSQKRYQEAASTFEKMIAMGRNTGQEYYLLGRSYYYAGNAAAFVAKDEKDAAKKKELETLATTNFLEADSAFLKLTELRPTLTTGYFWRARANVELDPDTKQGLAIPHYQKFIELATAEDVDKHKKDLLEAYQTIAYHHVQKEEYPYSQATAAYKKIKELDPGNKDAEKFFTALREYEQQLKEQP